MHQQHSGASSEADAIELLTDEHRNTLRMFDHFLQIQHDADQDEDAKRLIGLICAELTMHARIEQEIFYPALRHAMTDRTLIDEALAEHLNAAHLIDELAAMQAGDRLYAAKFVVLGEYVRHHIEEEQEKLFPLARKSGLDLIAIGRNVHQRRAELRRELAVEDDSGHIMRHPVAAQNGSSAYQWKECSGPRSARPHA